MGVLDKLWFLLRWVFRVTFVLVNNLYCIPTYVVWCWFLYPLFIWNPDYYWLIEGQFFQWLLTMVAYWSYSAGYYIVETGDSIDDFINEETLVLANHQSTSDVPLLMHAFSSRNGLLQHLNWIMDAVFQYTNFGVVSTLHGDFFINAGRERRDASLRDLEKYLKSTFLPRKRKWLMLFPEGGFLRKRKEASKRYAEKMNLPNLEYVTLPRMGAIQTIINTLAPSDSSTSCDVMSSQGVREPGSRLKYIIDMTIAYPDGKPLDLGSIVTGSEPPCKIHMHYKVYHIDEIPHRNPDELQAWLYNRYIEKNNMLGHYYKTKIFNPEFFYIPLPTEDFKSMESITSESDTRIPSRRSAHYNSEVVDEARQYKSGYLFGDGYIARLDVNAVNKELHDERIISSSSECIYPALSEEERIELERKTIHLDLLRTFLLHVMFITSTLLHSTAFWLLIRNMPGGEAA